jgi:hypothetical protein
MLAIVASVPLAPRAASAQPVPPTPTPTPTPTPEPAPPDEDLGDIEAAIAEDSAAATATTSEPEASRGGTMSLNPDISVIVDLSVGGFSADENLQAGDHDPHENGFNLQSLELVLSKAVDPYFRLDTNLVVGEEGVEIEEVYGTTLDLPANLQLRAGKFLTRFGRVNATHPHQWDFLDQPFALSRVFGGEGNRGLGAELSWLAPTDWYTEVVGSVTDARGEGTARSFLGESEMSVESPLDLQATLALRQFYELSHDLSLAAGASYAVGPNPSGEHTRTHLVGVDVYLKYRPITFGSYTVVALQSEWIYRRRQLGDARLGDLSGYAYVFWRFARRWGTAARYEYGSPAKDGDGMTGLDDLDPDWTSGRHRVSANLTFWPTEFSRLRLQGSVDAPGWMDDPIYAAFLSLELSIGPHGAHKF